MSKKEEVEKLVEFAFRGWTGLDRTESGNWEGRKDSTFLRVFVNDDGERIYFLSPIVIICFYTEKIMNDICRTLSDVN